MVREVHADVVAATAKQKDLQQLLQQELQEAEKVVREVQANGVVDDNSSTAAAVAADNSSSCP